MFNLYQNMKKIFPLVMLVFGLGLSSCRQAAFLSVDEPHSFSFSDQGGSQILSFSTNQDWQISVSESWVRVSPASGTASDGTITVTIDCEANSSFDARSASLILRAGEFSETILVIQDTNLGLFVSASSLELSSAEQTVSVTTQANVAYSVEIDDACKSWVSVIQSKALTESVILLLISQNDGEERSGTVRLTSDGITEQVIIKQNCGNLVFEDAYFKAYCVEKFDKDGDGEVSFAEARDVTQIIVTGGYYNSSMPSAVKISSLQGIEHMPNLNDLRCEGNLLTSIDVSKNAALEILRCGINQLTSLDLSNNPALVELNCWRNPMTRLDVSKNAALTGLIVERCQFTDLDVSHNPVLEYLYCNDNRLTDLDVSNNPELATLHIGNNLLTSIDVSQNINLKNLTCRENPITCLDVSNNPLLISLDVDYTPITSLDVSKNPDLRHLYCRHNPYLTELWMQEGHTFINLDYDSEITKIWYKD